jgi:extracellular factor (EF) 3-hydroxypalmitic acid methyl ester biosynthesis protein
MSLACGPAAEAFDVLENRHVARPIHFHLIDIDPLALEFVHQKAAMMGVQHLLTLHRANVFRLMGRRKSDLPPVDFAYSLGLIDYFDDRHVQRLLDLAYETLAFGGR